MQGLLDRFLKLEFADGEFTKKNKEFLMRYSLIKKLGANVILADINENITK